MSEPNSSSTPAAAPASPPLNTAPVVPPAAPLGPADPAAQQARALDALNHLSSPALPSGPPSAPPTVASAFVPHYPPGYVGRRYGFLCGYCSSRLEATENMAGQSGTCPTCGNTIIIPILDYRGRLIDPTTGQIVKQDPHPVHAYAAAGHRAPQIVAIGENGERQIQCPRCQRLNALSANNCIGCGLPFTMDGTMGDAISGTNTWAVASLVLGIVGLTGGFCFFAVPPILAVIFGVVSMRGSQQTAAPAGQGMAIAGIILGAIGILLFAGIIGLNVIH